MKVRIKLDKDSVQQFFLEHTEKIVFVGVVACFLVFTSQSLTRKNYDKRPEELNASCNNAETHIADTTFDNLVKSLHEFNHPDYAKILGGTRLTIREEFYTLLGPMDTYVRPVRPQREMPQLFAVEQLRAEAGAGAFTGAKGQQGQRFVVLTGLVPHAKLVDAFNTCFERAVYTRSEEDKPRYFGFIVERVKLASPGEKPDFTQAKQFFWWKDAPNSSGRASQADVVDRQCVEESLTAPLPQRLDRRWGVEAAHDPAIPVLTNEGLSPRDGRGPIIGAAQRKQDAPPPGLDDNDPLKLNPSNDQDRTKPPAEVRPVEDAKDQVNKYHLLRFFDFDEIEPNAVYAYRVFLVLRNPNQGVPAKYLRDADLATPVYIGDVRRVDNKFQIDKNYAYAWSAPSKPVTVPEDIHVLAVAVKPPKGNQEASATVKIVKWLDETGYSTTIEFPLKEGAPLVRGKLLDFMQVKPPGPPRRADPFQPAPVRGVVGGRRTTTPAAAATRIDCVTGQTVVDVTGGEPLSLERAAHGDVPTRPGEVLLLDKSGELVAHNELDDQAVLARQSQEAETPDATAPRGGMMKTATGGSGTLDDGVFGTLKKPKPTRTATK